MVQRREWQIEALAKFEVATNKYFLLDVTPGAGKTFFAGFCTELLFQNKIIDFAIAVVPTTAIKGDADAGFQGDWHRLNIEITTVLKDGRPAPTEFRGAVITYHQLPNIIGTFETWVRNGIRIFVIFDEIHHTSENNIWGETAEHLGSIATRVLSMTGTCFRSDGRQISFVNYDDDKKAIADFTYGYREAVMDDVCRKVDFMVDDSMTQFMLNNENHNVRISEVKNDDDIRGATATIFRSDKEFLPRLLEKADDTLDQYRNWDSDAGGLIICRSGRDEEDDERYLYHIAKLVKDTFDENPEVISYDDKDANAKIERFRKSNQRWLCAVRKISEGVDIKRLRVLVMATRPTTELLFRQIIGRVVRVDDEKRPGTATVYIAKFPQLQKWAEKIAEEAEAGFKARKPKTGTGTGGDQKPSAFVPLRANHEDGGAISDHGDHFTVDEINAAEKLRSNDPQIYDISITTLAYLQRKLGVIPEQGVKAEPPLQIRKKQLRSDVVKKARHLAYKRNHETPDFKRVWLEIRETFGPRNADDLVDNYSLDVMRQILHWLVITIASA